jgi:uncharacterized LabA/DUF88 family protein
MKINPMSSNPKFVAKIESEEATQKLAVLIDADNAQAAVIEGLLAEIARFGEASVKRIYGDFTSPASAQWKKVLQKFAIKPVQQFAYTTGKNATDSMMIIDAMDLLYTKRFDGFCIVSSDSDFTGLAMRIKEEGLAVYGFGEQKTPESFRNSCHKFIFTEVLRPEVPVSTSKPPIMDKHDEKETSTSQTQLSNKKIDTDTVIFLKEAAEKASAEDGWAHIGTFGDYLRKLKPEFDSRNYGYKKLSELVKSEKDIFTVEERPQPNSEQKTLYLRPKPPEGNR